MIEPNALLVSEFNHWTCPGSRCGHPGDCVRIGSGTLIAILACEPCGTRTCIVILADGHIRRLYVPSHSMG